MPSPFSTEDRKFFHQQLDTLLDRLAPYDARPNVDLIVRYTASDVVDKDTLHTAEVAVECFVGEAGTFFVEELRHRDLVDKEDSELLIEERDTGDVV